ncbi:hypothetical protein MHYP_G00307160 [Metynnis hypsauchen]
MWSGLRTSTDYKEGVICDRGSSSSLADELNAHYARFEATNTSSAEKLPVDEESCTLAIPLCEVVRSFRAVNPRKAPGFDGIHIRTSRGHTLMRGRSRVQNWQRGTILQNTRVLYTLTPVSVSLSRGNECLYCAFP